MTLPEFENSTKQNQLPSGASVYLQALWYDAKGDWKTAHNLVDSLEGSTAAAVHAYLHRVEGDNGNAGYWYKRADRKIPEISLQEEWKRLVEELLKEST
ncbi:MAG: hypothetical protein M3R72_11665 [Bacteroidota bacterium]|nr:hypothetical protein [Bacteroidota bacterium]